MCGIFGALGRRDVVTEELVSRALSTLEHRGPDGQGRLHIAPTTHSGRILRMGHRRLAILDLSEQGRQPMVDRSSGNTIVYNGEVYNFKTLRDRLVREGALFDSQTDTEVVLKWFGRHGLPELLSDIVGMFAFGIWDERRQRLILVRDHTGIKPFYYYRDENVFMFASEVRTLVTTGLIPKELDPVALESYLAYGAVQGPNTVVRGIKSLPPAHYLVVESDGSCGPPQRYWVPPFVPESQATPADSGLLRSFRGLLEQVVSEHLCSDVPLGAFLSGGIDSSSVVALMARAAPGRVHTFSVVFDERSHSEAPYSRLMAERTGATHEEINLTEETLLEWLPDMLLAIDAPSVDGPNVFAISRAVRAKGVTVVLSGQGGDEVLGGYPSFPRLNLLSHLQPLLRYVPEAVLGAAASATAVFTRCGPRMGKVSDLVRSSKSILSSYLVSRQMMSQSVRSGLRPDYESCPFGLPAHLYEELDSTIHGLHPINQVSALEMATYLSNMLLRDGDIMSMAHGIETRVPFLDRRVIDFLAQVSGPDKLSRSLPKPLLVRALMDLLPEPIYQRPKQGFTLPWQRWLRQSLRSTVGAVLDNRDCGVQLGFAPGGCQRVWRSFLEGAATPWTTVWALFVLVNWCVRYEVYCPVAAGLARDRLVEVR
jgi:asparagine synthase (glutamine-hydrolysing)